MSGRRAIVGSALGAAALFAGISAAFALTASGTTTCDLYCQAKTKIKQADSVLNNNSLGKQKQISKAEAILEAPYTDPATGATTTITTGGGTDCDAFCQLNTIVVQADAALHDTTMNAQQRIMTAEGILEQPLPPPPPTTTATTTTAPTTTAPTTTTTTTTPPPATGRIWGTTLDNDAGISTANLAAQVAALGGLPLRPTTRMVWDWHTTPSDYTAAVSAIHPVSDLMGELADSSEVKSISVDSYTPWVQSFVDAFKSQVDIWEVGNEVNGEWVGTPSAEMARVSAAYNIVKSAGLKTDLTLYYNPNCWSKSQNEMFTWLAAGNVPATMAAGLDYVTISYYPSDCNNYWPSATEWQSVFDRLHAIFPNAKLGFGESGDSRDSLTGQQNVALFDRYAAVSINGDNYVGGYFWWYWAEDAIPKGNTFWTGFAAAIS